MRSCRCLRRWPASGKSPLGWCVAPDTRQADSEDAPVSRQILHIDRAVVEQDGAACDGKAKAQAFTVSVPLIKRLEKVAHGFRIQPAALILYLDERSFADLA